MKDRKLHIVKFSIGDDMDYDCLKAFSSKMLAQYYVECACKKFLKGRFDSKNGRWEDDLTYVYDDAETGYKLNYEIEEVDFDTSITLPLLPEVEHENLILKEENNELRKQLAYEKGLNSVARCYLTMYDGGWKYAKEHVIENMHSARAVLEDGERGNTLVLKLFEDWQKAKCHSCKEKK